ncbi:hypothetical protein [Paramicrobacterium fandaimingii]|uniref:hypothetical protein n=1 Tax=Paramicrobacterium fandaimingii TaxID=2708079 RepID=UPI00141DBF71|nr:hypothetical protein [Microbacterium fandaimingii]
MTPYKVREIVNAMQRAPANVHYRNLAQVCEHYFGPLAAIRKMEGDDDSRR